MNAAQKRNVEIALLYLVQTSGAVAVNDLPDEDSWMLAVSELFERGYIRMYSKTVDGVNRMYLTPNRKNGGVPDIASE